MTRKAKILQTAADWLRYYHPTCTQDMLCRAFECDAQWADEHPKNPWKDAKTDPPKEGQEVFAHIPNLCGGEYCKLTYLGNYRWSQDDGEWTTEFYNNEVCWMPIPENNNN